MEIDSRALNVDFIKMSVRIISDDHLSRRAMEISNIPRALKITFPFNRRQFHFHSKALRRISQSELIINQGFLSNLLSLI